MRELSDYIKQNAISWHIHYIEHDVIDNINIRQAVLQGMRECIKQILLKMNFDRSDYKNINDYYYNNKVYKNSLNEENYIGTFHFKKNNIHILFKDTYKIYKIKDYGKYFISNGAINDNSINNNKTNIKLIAIVFPQYHEFYENNLFWGKGFTEWTLLKKTEKIVKDEYIKHPHKDIGYYNLKDYDHRKYMKVLADKYNIYGFCYYHYWFKNSKILYEPTELMLLDGEPNKPFLF